MPSRIGTMTTPPRPPRKCSVVRQLCMAFREAFRPVLSILDINTGPVQLKTWHFVCRVRFQCAMNRARRFSCLRMVAEVGSHNDLVSAALCGVRGPRNLIRSITSAPPFLLGSPITSPCHVNRNPARSDNWRLDDQINSYSHSKRGMADSRPKAKVVGRPLLSSCMLQRRLSCQSAWRSQRAAFNNAGSASCVTLNEPASPRHSWPTGIFSRATAGMHSHISRPWLLLGSTLYSQSAVCICDHWELIALFETDT